MRTSAKLLFALLLPLAACRRGAPLPVALAPDDMCAYCKMAVSEKAYAAEFLSRDGDAVKFDDIGCMRKYVAARQNRAEIDAVYVMTVDEKQWRKAEEAFFVRSDRFHTPMGGGIVAFRVRARAEAEAGAGKVLSWADVQP